MSAVARRYAVAAVEAAAEAGGNAEVEALAEGLRGFAEVYRGAPDLRELMKNPALADGREGAVRAAGKKLGLSLLAVNVLLVLAENHRFGLIDDVVAEVLDLADQKLGRRRAHVVSAIPLSPSNHKRLEAALEGKLGAPVVLDVEVDPSILGGLVVQIGSVTIDSSVKRQLDRLSERLRGEP